MSFNFEGRRMDFKFVQLQNTPFPIVFNPEDKQTFDSCTQFLKASSFMYFTLDGIFISASLSQPINVLSPMNLTCAGMLMSFKFSQFSKVSSFMDDKC